MATCRFCGRDAKLTREHVWSNNLLRRFDAEAPKTFDWSRDRVHDADPMVKDLCQRCNGGMSDADAAIMSFAETYLSGNFNSWDYIPFDDPDLLRWALKTACNMERSLKAPTTWWRPFIPYFVTGARVEDIERADLLLAPWRDMTPLGMEAEVDPIV